MKIEIEVSEDNEGTAAPWWLIVDPKQNMDCSHAAVAMGMITGPYFSREAAEEYLRRTRYNFSKRAVVWCSSGCYSEEYLMAIKRAEKKCGRRMGDSK